MLRFDLACVSAGSTSMAAALPCAACRAPNSLVHEIPYTHNCKLNVADCMESSVCNIVVMIVMTTKNKTTDHCIIPSVCLSCVNSGRYANATHEFTVKSTNDTSCKMNTMKQLSFEMKLCANVRIVTHNAVSPPTNLPLFDASNYAPTRGIKIAQVIPRTMTNRESVDEGLIPYTRL